MLGYSRTKIARAKNSGGAAGGHIRQAQCKGAALACPPKLKAKVEASEAEGRANQTKFDIFCKRPARLSSFRRLRLRTTTDDFAVYSENDRRLQKI